MKVHPAFQMEGVQVSVQVTEHVNFYIINNLEEIPQLILLAGIQAREQVLSKIPRAKYEVMKQLLSLCIILQKQDSVLAVSGLSKVYKNYASNILILIENNLISRTIPGNPKDPRQKYYTTLLGKKLLEMLK